MPITSEGRLVPQSISADVRVLEEALTERPARHAYPLGVNGSCDHARDVRAWSDDFDKACDPARLRRVLDTMQAMADALNGLLSDPGEDRIRSRTWDAARAALALYEGTK